MKLGYIIANECWHHEILKHMLDGDHVAEIMILINPCAGNTANAEFAIRWYQFIGDPQPTPRIEMFADAWKFLPELQGFLYELSKRGVTATPETVVAILNSLHAEDLTRRERGIP